MGVAHVVSAGSAEFHFSVPQPSITVERRASTDKQEPLLAPLNAFLDSGVVRIAVIVIVQIINRWFSSS